MSNKNTQLLTEAYIQLYPQLTALSTRFHRGNKQLAEDSLHRTFLNLQKAKPEVELRINSLTEFVKAALYNECLNVAKTNRVFYNFRDSSYKPIAQTRDTNENDLADVLDSVRRQEAVAKFANTLPPKQRNVFLGMLECKSTREMANETGNAFHTIKHNKRLVIEKLHAYFKQINEEFNYD